VSFSSFFLYFSSRVALSFLFSSQKRKKQR